MTNLKDLFDFGKWVEMTGKQKHDVLWWTPGDSGPRRDPLLRRMTVNNKGGNERPLTSWEVTKLRGLLGALQWPATQGLPPLSASVSLQAADVNQANHQHRCRAQQNPSLRKEHGQGNPHHDEGDLEPGGMPALCALVMPLLVFVRRPCGDVKASLSRNSRGRSLTRTGASTNYSLGLIAQSMNSS